MVFRKLFGKKKKEEPVVAETKEVVSTPKPKVKPKKATAKAEKPVKKVVKPETYAEKKARLFGTKK